jgi:hypothetical protein
VWTLANLISNKHYPVYIFIFHRGLFYDRFFPDSTELLAKITLGILIVPLNFVLVYWFWIIPRRSRWIFEMEQEHRAKVDAVELGEKLINKSDKFFDFFSISMLLTLHGEKKSYKN